MMLLNASGCLDALTAPVVARSLDAYVTKTVTPLPREGNRPVRIAESDRWLLNSIGLANPGAEAFATSVLPRLADLGVPVWVSAGGFSADDFAHVCARLDGEPAVSAIEVNLSCPNVEAPAEGIFDLVAAARAGTSKPLYAKLSPQLSDLAEAARAAEAAGADGLTLVNTLRGLALVPRTLAPILAPGHGGLSGPALKPIALAAVHACFRATALPIVGCGGVATARDVVDFLAVGARAVQIGTALFIDPQVPERIRAGLPDVLAEVGVAALDDVVGWSHGGARRTDNPQVGIETFPLGA